MSVEGGEHIGALYFDGIKLKEWSTAPSTMKLEGYERIRTVGQGNVYIYCTVL